MYELALQAIKNSTVKVMEGSGVIICPFTDEYSYIFTAKHVISEIDIEDIHIESVNGLDIRVLDKLEHDDIDLAILKISKVAEGVHFYESNYENFSQNLKLYGYPQQNRHQEKVIDQLGSYNCEPHDIGDEKYIFLLNGIAPIDDVEGFSGGGIFSIDRETGSFSILAVEVGMTTPESSNSQVDAIKIDRYIEILNKNNWQLVIPSYLRNFEMYKSIIFEDVDLENDGSLNGIKECLHTILEQYGVTNSLTINPNSILEKFENKILTYEQKKNDLYNRCLWRGFLEFFSIYLYLNPPFDSDSCNENYLDELFVKFRFIFDHKKVNFKKLFRTYILETDFGPLDELSKILIFSPLNASLGNPILDKKVSKMTLTDISSSIGSQKHRIEVVKRNRNIRNEILHWPSVNNKCLSDNEDDYSRYTVFDSEQVKESLNNSYGEFLADE
ncbi:trypsin-like peptidase domain-containing protein [Photobacterium damselae subsp. damselae]|uniref:ABC-three component system protein n=1 Tax=Photobacterium damselae TaxID=38293 RepID=UPI0010FE9465|nr:ABC-three component system protein [Photobacterium damselae]TLS82396.1 trypsin-like peptidase domain-containing protein [Photobacterium damselae subsp. damselae]TLS90629.1 trypsin-like peptidase domain-containing protein [Photobacterium damselae subsp. damselae]